MDRYCKVVIIDDEFIMRQGMKHMMNWEEEGFQVVGEATNGREGLDLIEKLMPDIVLADIVMPVLDGIEFSKILKERYPDIQLIILSSYDKFEYVKETLLNGAVDYILKPSMNPGMLLKTLKKAASNIPGMQTLKQSGISFSGRLERMLTGYGESPDEASIDAVFPHSRYALAAMNLKSVCDNRKPRMAKAEQEVKEETMSCGEFVSVPLFLNEELLCLVFNFRVKDEIHVYTRLEACAKRISEIYKDTFFVVGKSFSGTEHMKESYNKEILPYVDRQFYYPGKSILFVKDAKEQERTSRFAFEEYTGCLQYKQFGKALEMFREYIYYILDAQVDEYKVKNLTKNLLYNYLMEIERYHVPSEELRLLYFKNLDESRDVDKFRREFEAETAHLQKILKEQVEVEEPKVLEMKDYIARHYNEELDLKELSRIFGFNYHYLSSYFNQHTKEGFSEYLNKIRIEKACEMLRDSQCTIAEISRQAGYSDQSYFCRVFKKITGDTPSTYRRRKYREDSI